MPVCSSGNYLANLAEALRHDYCYSMQVELALGEAGINYTRFEVDLDNKPQWYSLKINPAKTVSM